MVTLRRSISNLERLRDIGAERTEKILLDKNERIAAFPDEFIESLRCLIDSESITKYPDQTELYQALSKFLGLEADQLLLVNGSDSGIKTIFEAAVHPGDIICHLEPTYAMAGVYANMFDCHSRQIKFDYSLQLTVEDLSSYIEPDIKLVYLANPNQPTGTCFRTSELEVILGKAVETGTLVIVDEAYIEFSETKGALPLLAEFSNVCVLRTFSKAWGMAGLRLGYIVANPALIVQFAKTRSLLDINSIALNAAKLLIDQNSIVQDYVAEVLEGKRFIKEFCKKNEIEFVNTRTNFAFIRIPERKNTKSVVRKIANGGFRVKCVEGTSTVLDGCIRFTIGPVKQAQIFANSVLRALQ